MIALRWLSRADALAAGAGDWVLALDDVRATTRLLRSGEAGMVAESVLPMGSDPRSNAYGLPAFVGGAYDAAGIKWAVHRAEPAGDLPSITSTTFVNRYSDGRPVGLVESALLTRMRTGAVSAIAMRSLAPPSLRRVAVLGAGAQARAHVEMLRALFPDVETIRIWNRDPGRRDALIAELAAAGLGELVAAPSIPQALEAAQVVLCCTTAPQPLLDRQAVAPGRLIVQVGYNEIGFDLIDAVDHVVVDLWGEFAERSAKSLFQMYRAGRFKPERVSADLAGLVVDGWQPREAASVLFSSFGLNVFDIALAARVLRQAEADGLGTTLPLF
jgi:ornithine cyclodeaminase